MYEFIKNLISNCYCHFIRCRKRDMWQTPWPEWVYEQFDIQRLVRRVAEKFNMLCKAKLN